MIKKYQSFYESFSITKNFESIEDAYEDFSNCLIETHSYFDESDNNMAMISYGYAAQYGRKFDPESDFKLIDSYMSKKGWSIENVKRLANSYKNFVEKVYDLASITACGSFDYYLYVITNKKFYLQGHEWHSKKPSETDDEGLLQDDYLIKFRYGWHKTKYGKLVIEQNVGNIDNFIKVCFDYLPIVAFVEIVFRLEDKFNSTLTKNKFIEDKKNEAKFCFSKEAKNEYFVDSRQLLIIFNKEMSNKISQSEFDNIVSNTMNYFNIDCRILSHGDIMVSLS